MPWQRSGHPAWRRHLSRSIFFSNHAPAGGLVPRAGRKNFFPMSRSKFHLRRLGAIASFILFLSNWAYSQCQCPTNYTEVVIPAGQTVTTSSLGTSAFHRYCFNIGANATLEINDLTVFSECRFMRDSDSKMVVTSSGGASFTTNAGAGQNEIITCGPNNLTLPIAGLIVHGRVYVYDLRMDLGFQHRNRCENGQHGLVIQQFDDPQRV